ncbi:MAG: J domain-containing protein, partial [Alphaproteobacteria bacterium]|nr:J domain-containing protein [Alphaproteobacteria bacterium]
QFGGMDGMEDIFAEFMGGTQGKRGRQSQSRGSDANYALTIPFVEACLGGKRRVTLSNDKTIDITIPPGVNDGHKMRLRGQGMPGATGPGDGIVELHIEPHPYFTRKDNDLTLEAPISLPEAILGGTITVPTLTGPVAVKVPKGANNGTSLRLKGKGVPHGKDQKGDMFVKLRVVLPDNVDDELAEAVEKWSKKHSYDPRKNTGW